MDNIEQEEKYAEARNKALAGQNPTKSRFKALIRQAVTKLAAFGATSEEKDVERPIGARSVNAECITKELDAAFPTHCAETGKELTPEEIEKLKTVREQLRGLWSVSAKEDYSPDDKYIEGIPGNTTVNFDAGDSGCRIKFKSAPRTSGETGNGAGSKTGQ